MKASNGIARSARAVFVVHGRNTEVRDAMFEFLRAVDLRPIEWSEAITGTGRPTPSIPEILRAAFARARAVVVLLTPDDKAVLRERYWKEGDPDGERRPSGQARPNVLFEAGMAMAFKPERTILVQFGSLRPFSDIGGLHVVRFRNDSQTRQNIASRLETAGCPVNLAGTDWHTAGDFNDAVMDDDEESFDEQAPQATGWREVSDFSELSENARSALQTMAGTDAPLVKFASLADTRFLVGRRSFSPRVFEEMLEANLIRDESGEGKRFILTHAGYQAADGLQ